MINTELLRETIIERVKSCTDVGLLDLILQLIPLESEQ